MSMFGVLSVTTPPPRTRPGVHTRRRACLLFAAGLVASAASVTFGQQVTTTWIAPQSGSFFDDALWSGGLAPDNNVPPGTTYRVVIDAAGNTYIVTLDADVTIDELVLNSASATLLHSAGVFRALQGVTISQGSYLLDGGTIANTTINVAGGSMQFGSSPASVLDAVTVNGDLTLSTNGSRVRAVNGLTLNGTVHLSGANSQIGFSDTITVPQGTFSFESAAGSRLSTESGQTLTLGAGVLVQATAGAFGIVGSGYFSDSNTSVVNQGTITASDANSRINIAPTSFINQGTINVNSGATIALGATNASWSNTGSINVNGGTLLLGGNFAASDVATINAASGSVLVTGVLDASAGVIVTSPGMNFGVRGGRINGGTIVATPGSPLLIQQESSSTSVLNNVTVIGDIAVDVPNVQMRIDNGLSLAGGLNFNADNTVVYANTSHTIDGGTITFNAPSNAALTQWIVDSGTTLTLSSGTTVHGGRGTFSGSSTGATLINNGLISADRAGQNIGISTRTFVNNGTLQTAGGTLTLGSLSTTNNGSIIINSGTLNLANAFVQSPGATMSQTGGVVQVSGVFDNAGASINLNPGSTWRLSQGNTATGGEINGGSLTIQGGATFDVVRGLLNGVDVTGNFSLGVAHQLTIRDSLSLTGQLTINEGFVRIDTVALPGTININGGTIAIARSGTGGGSDAITLAPGRTVVLSPTTTLRGGRGLVGTPTTNGPANTILNQGLISADLQDRNLTIRSGIFQNAGTAQAIAGGVLEISYDTAWTNTGTIRAMTNGTLLLSGRTTSAGFGNIEATGGTFFFTGLMDNTSSTFAPPAAMGTMRLTSSGSIKGGTIDLTQGGRIVVQNGPAILDETSVIGNLDVIDFGNLEIRNGISLNGDLRLAGPSATVRFNGPQTFASGRIIFDPTGGGNDRLIQTINEGVLTIGPAASIEGGRGLVFTSNANGIRGTIINQGLIRANVAGERIAIYQSRFSNQGTVEAVNGGIIDLIPPSATPEGMTVFNDGAFLINDQTFINIEGSLIQSGSGLLQFHIGLDGDALVTPLRVSSLFSIDGALSVLMSESGTPTWGSSYHLFDAAEVQGSFATTSFPILGGGLHWDVSELYTHGTITVVPAPASLVLLSALGSVFATRRRRSHRGQEVRS